MDGLLSDPLAAEAWTAEAAVSEPLPFVDFYRDERDRLSRALALTVGDGHLAAEAVDEAMVRAYQRWDRVGTFESPGGWVYRVALNWATSVLRRRSRAPRPPAERSQHELGPMDEPSVRAALAELDLRQRSVVVCRYYLGLNEAETAAALNIRPGTVKSRLHRGLRCLDSPTSDPRRTDERPRSRPQRHRRQPRRPAPRRRCRRPARPGPGSAPPAPRRHHRRRRSGGHLGGGPAPPRRRPHHHGGGGGQHRSLRRRRPGLGRGRALLGAQLRPAQLHHRVPVGAPLPLSTAPGEAGLDGLPQARVVWQSDDGVDWAASPLSDDIFLSDLAVSDERIYAVGTGPATAAMAGGRAVPDVVVGWSDDGAESWETTTLPIDMAAIAGASRSVSMGEALAVVTTPDATVATASVFADLDLPRFLPDGVTAPHGWAVTAEGVDLLGPAPGTCPEGTSRPEGWFSDASPAGNPPGRIWGVDCYTSDGESQVPAQEALGITRSFTWDELGVTGDLRRAALGQPLAFAAPAGSTDFERVELPGGGIGGGGVALHGDESGFLLIVPGSVGPGGRSQSTVLSSAEGETWSEAEALPGGLSGISAAGRVKDTFVLVGQMGDGSSALLTDRGAGWETTPLDELVGSENTVYFNGCGSFRGTSGSFRDGVVGVALLVVSPSFLR